MAQDAWYPQQHANEHVAVVKSYGKIFKALASERAESMKSVGSSCSIPIVLHIGLLFTYTYRCPRAWFAGTIARAHGHALQPRVFKTWEMSCCGACGKGVPSE